MYCFVGGKEAEEVTLDAFFPFDPLPLKKTVVFVENAFQEWCGCDAPDEELDEVELDGDVDY